MDQRLTESLVDFGAQTAHVDVDHVRQWIEVFIPDVLRGLLAKETVEWAEEGGSHKIQFLTPELKLINLDDAIPIHMSAFGPRGRALTAKLGAGWMCGGNRRGAIHALGAMREAWSAAGRNEKDLYATTFGNGCVLRDGEAADSPRARAQAGPSATMIFHDLAEQEELGSLGFKLPPQFQAQLNAYRAIYGSYQPPDARYLSNHRGHLNDSSHDSLDPPARLDGRDRRSAGRCLPGARGVAAGARKSARQLGRRFTEDGSVVRTRGGNAEGDVRTREPSA